MHFQAGRVSLFSPQCRGRKAVALALAHALSSSQEEEPSSPPSALLKFSAGDKLLRSAARNNTSTSRCVLCSGHWCQCMMKRVINWGICPALVTLREVMSRSLLRLHLHSSKWYFETISECLDHNNTLNANIPKQFLNVLTTTIL
jgi:hypothetical protein